MEDFQFHRRGGAAAVPRKVAAGGRGKPPVFYEEVIGGPQRHAVAAPSSVPARPEDYREIFGAATACPIPVLDLPPPGDGFGGGGYEFRQCSALDYLDIFGGFDGGDFAVSYEELFASQELHKAPPATNTSGSSRGLCEKQEMPVPEVVAEELSGGQVELSLNGVAQSLNDGADRWGRSNHMASGSSKHDPVNGTIHKNQVCATPGFAFVVDKPHTLEDVDIFFDSNCSEGISEGSHLMKTVLPPSCIDVKHSVIDTTADQRSSLLELSGSLSASACELNPSCSSKNQSTVPYSNGLSAWMSINHTLHEDFMGKKTEVNCQNKTVPIVMSASITNVLKDKCSASEDGPTNEDHLSCSSDGHSTSSGDKSFLDYAANDISVNAVNTRMAEINHFQESMSGSPPCTGLHSTEKDKMAEQKMSNSMPNCPKNAPIMESKHSHSSSTHSISSLDQPYSDGVFLTVSDINLRTEPSRGPPPARPPPARPPSKSGVSERNLRRTLTDHRDRDVRSGFAYKTLSFKQGVRDVSPPTFDVEVDASSAAAASVAAIKEAMELAQARLKSAKVSMERKKDNLQGRRKLGSKEELKSMKRRDDETIQEHRRIREEGVDQLPSEKTDGKGNAFAAEKMAAAFSASKLTADIMERERICGSAEESPPSVYWGKAGLSDLSNKREGKVGGWEVQEQFYDLVQSGKEFQKSPENSLREGSEKKLNERFGIVGEGPNASELEKNEKLLAPSKVVESEGGSDILQETSLTSKEQIKASKKPTQESYVEGECVLNLKESINAHHQQKKPGEAQELHDTEAKWRTSEEAFICELSEKNLRITNNAFKCKSVHEHQGQDKTQSASDESHCCDEIGKEIGVIEKYFEGQEEEEDDKVWGRLSELDENKKETKVANVSYVSVRGILLNTVSKGHENENPKMSVMTDEYGCFHESEDIEQKNVFGQDNRKMPNVTHQENENGLKAAVWVHDWEGDDGNLNEVLETNGCNDRANKLKDIQKFPIETEKAPQQEAVKQNTSMVYTVDDLEDKMIAQGDYKKKVDENIKEVHIVVDSNKEVQSGQDACIQTRNENKTGDAQQTISLGEQWHICKAAQESAENQGVGWSIENRVSRIGRFESESADSDWNRPWPIPLPIPSLPSMIENDSEGLETGADINEKMGREQARNLEERERETSGLEERERERMKLEKERERKRIELEVENEREMKKLEEAKKEERIKLEEEKERARRKLEEEKERERRRLEEERERKRWLQEEKQERERKKLEEEERERKRLEEEERERSKLEEGKKRKLKEERERMKLEEEEKERRKLEETERKRKKQAEEDRERSKLEEREGERREQEEERERRRLEEVEREGRRLEQKVRERRIEEEKDKKIEDEKVRESQKIEEEKMREKKLEEKARWRKVEEENERERIKLEEERDREREREKDRQAVEKATREAHERAFAEARERVERAAVEKATAEARQRALAETRERAEKASAEALEKSMAEKASREARLRVERAAVERATAEARERAVEKALAEKAAQDARERAEKLATTSRDGVKQNTNFSNVRDFDSQFQNAGTSSNSYQIHSDFSHLASLTNEKFGGSEVESAIRCKARMERHQRTVERAAKALAEKNLRDIIAQREQAERNRLAETLDADVKRWSNGKEGNLRALLSTLQYILGPESGWQPIPLTDVVTAPGVKKAYRKATLCVHPDKLQQRGASIQQKYICEKVFDLLKEAWNKFNSEER